MTKDELRSALSEKGVSSPSSARKDELVALYKSVNEADTNGGGGGGDIFSADESQDEIVVSPSPKKVSSASSTKSPKKVSAKSVDLNLTAGGGVANDSLILGDFDVSQLTDDQLAEALVERKIAVGPIVESTRKIYRRKLIAAMREESTNGGSEEHHSGNGTTENGHDISTEQVELNNGDFSADDEEVLSGGKVAENNGLNEVSEENGGAEVETEEEDEDDQQPSVVISKSQEPVDSSTTSPVASIRKRFAGPSDDSTDGATVGSTERFTPTPRRSIHSYKVTETTRQTLTKSKDGTITHDFDYKKETSESKGSLGNTTRGRLASVLRLLPGFFLILLIIVLAYYVYTKRK